MFSLRLFIRNVFLPADRSRDDFCDTERLKPLSLAELIAASAFYDAGGLAPDHFRRWPVDNEDTNERR